MKTKEFDYDLPSSLIAQHPAAQRDASRLLVLRRDTETIEHSQFADLKELLHPGDILIANDSRVIPARLYGKKESGGRVEILLLRREDELRWQALVGGKRLRRGSVIAIVDKEGRSTGHQAIITKELDGALRQISFSEPVEDALEFWGHLPLPPYIHEPLADEDRYQTVYASRDGSAAAPTAGLHFTADLLLDLRDKGVFFDTCTLHVGLDTFRPVEAENVADHVIHSEWVQLAPAVARRINEAKLAGGRLIAVGTTAVRTLETAALRSAGIQGSLQDISARDAAGETTEICPWKPVVALEGPTDLFITPGYRFRAVDAVITNFHLPRSSLLMLVGAFAGMERMRRAYDTAKESGYRFYSFGDAMFMN